MKLRKQQNGGIMEIVCLDLEGDWRKEIREFCKYFPNLRVDRVE